VLSFRVLVDGNGWLITEPFEGSLFNWEFLLECSLLTNAFSPDNIEGSWAFLSCCKLSVFLLLVYIDKGCNFRILLKLPSEPERPVDWSDLPLSRLVFNNSSVGRPIRTSFNDGFLLVIRTTFPVELWYIDDFLPFSCLLVWIFSGEYAEK
jgi:hypothetical protein